MDEPELSNGIIRRTNSLQTFLSTDSHTNMRRLDHGDIIGSIAN
jgi:hypothetical protein